MLSVQIKVNATQIHFIYAVRIKGEVHEWCEYDVFDNSATKVGHVRHHYDDGALVLTNKMILTANEYYRAHPIPDKKQTKIIPQAGEDSKLE
jgi:hypothetical protein